MNQSALWLTVNQNLVAKALGELAYEQVLRPTLVDSNVEGGGDRYQITLKSGVIYRFRAWRSVWDHLRVRPDSIERMEGSQTENVRSAGQFFVDAKLDLEMTDIVLGNFLEEMHSTLFSDMRLLEKSGGLTADELAEWDGNRLQTVLNGHPKILLNKGRMGWGASDLIRFAPESDEKFQLFWIALLAEKTKIGKQDGLELKVIYRESLSELELKKFEAELSKLGRDPNDYVLAPVHPWQWDRYIRVQFAGEIASGEIIPLGIAGDFYRPQISIRTLSNVTRPEKSDIKLPLSILNTSAIRGIPVRYIKSAPIVSEAVSRICEEDPVLKGAGTEVLQEKAGFAFEHPVFAQVKEAPYRYHEFLGVIWRESVASKLSSGEKGITTGSLFHQDVHGCSLIGAYMRKSGLSAAEWLQRYFDAVVIPLYHLQLKYGLGLVAHGQNIMLKLKNYAPAGMWLKDFHGDLRLSAKETELQNKFLASVTDHLDRLPPNYLIHDLLTGHFLTVLRFVSETLQECDGFPEAEFYRILAERIRLYQEQSGSPVEKTMDLLNEKVHRVLLNKVRFRIGYADSAERPLPMLGEDLKNPLHFGELK